MTLLTATALLVVGLLAGVINAVAGGGSLLTLPLLIFFGLPETVANATNRVGVLTNGIASAAGYHQSGHLPWGTVRRTLPAALIGSVLGAFVAARISDDAFRPVIAFVLLGMAALLVVRPQRWLGAREEVSPAEAGPTSSLPLRGRSAPSGVRSASGSAGEFASQTLPREPAPALPALAEVAVFFAIGVYGGFIQAGVGFFLLAATVRVAGHDLVRANGVKVTMTLAITAVAIGVFVLAGEIRWLEGSILAVGTTLGGYLGARTAVRLGAGWVRWVVVAMVVASALELLGVFRAIGKLLGA